MSESSLEAEPIPPDFLLEEYQPERAKDQHSQTGADDQEHKDRRTGLSLSRLRRRLHDLIVLFRFHAPSPCDPQKRRSARDGATPDL
jgi:hypothetical protein